MIKSCIKVTKTEIVVQPRSSDNYMVFRLIGNNIPPYLKNTLEKFYLRKNCLGKNEEKSPNRKLSYQTGEIILIVSYYNKCSFLLGDFSSLFPTDRIRYLLLWRTKISAWSHLSREAHIFQQPPFFILFFTNFCILDKPGNRSYLFQLK